MHDSNQLYDPMTLGVRGNVVASGGQGEGESLADMMLEFSPQGAHGNNNNLGGGQ